MNIFQTRARWLGLPIAAVTLSGGLFLGGRALVGASPGHGRVAPASSRAGVLQQLRRMPLSFVRNSGQLDRRAAYYVQNPSSALYFTPTGVRMAAFGREQAGISAPGPATPGASGGAAGWTVEQRFTGMAGPVAPVGTGRAKGIVSYFSGTPGQWRTGLPTYGGVLYRDVWPGIDVRYTGTAGRLEYTFVVRPGADPADIGVAYRGATSVALERGGLMVRTPLGGFADQPPVAYQLVDGRRVPVSAGFESRTGGGGGPSSYGFRVGGYDPGRTLVIDPVSIAYSGYIGGYVDDTGLAVAEDAAGNAYVVGQTNSTQATFPVRIGPYLNFSGQSDVFVCKVDGTTKLGQMDYCGYIGGTSSDRGRGVAVNADGEAYAMGWVRSTEDQGFPVLDGPTLKYHGGTSDAFVAKVSANGRRLLWCGYLGGSLHDEGKSIALDAQGNAYLTGGSKSDDLGGIGGQAAQPTAGGNGDAWVIEVSSHGQIMAGTYLGGANEDHARGIAVDPTGVYVGGTTASAPASFDPVVGPSLTYGGNGDSFAAKLSVDLKSFVYKGYVGGNQYEDTRDAAVDDGGHAFLCGHTASKDFPTTRTGLGQQVNGPSDAFITEVSADGTGLEHSGLIGGSLKDSCYGINVAASGQIFVAGHTSSDDFPVKNVDGYPNSLGKKYLGRGDGWVAEVDAGTAGMAFSGYFGGHAEDVIWASDYNGTAMVITGVTHSPETSFPVKVGPDAFYNGAADGFIAQIVPGGAQ